MRDNPLFIKGKTGFLAPYFVKKSQVEGVLRAVICMNEINVVPLPREKYDIMKHSAFTLYIILFLSSLSLQAQQIKIGNYNFPGGGEYQGEMFKGKPYGKGKTVYPNGDWHEGEYVKGKRQGQGIYQFADGEKYDGEWYGDQQHGKGIYYFANNNRYEGLWFKDYQQGLGTMYYYNGDTYVGSWMQD